MARQENRQGATFGYAQTRTRILDHIAANGFHNGDLLPSLKAMADEFCHGRIKRVRMAVAQLAQQGILEPLRGRGIFLRDRDQAILLSHRPVPKNTAVADDPYAASVPYALTIRTPCVRLSLVEKRRPFRLIWEEVVRKFNASRSDFQVALTFGDPPPIAASLNREAPDLFQLQSFRLAPYIGQQSLYDLSGSFDRELLGRFYPSLWLTPLAPDQAVWGLPITAVAGYTALNRRGARFLKTPLPPAWDFQEYVRFIESAAGQVVSPRRLRAVVFTAHSVLYHMALAGLWSSRRLADVPDFTSRPITEFLKSFERVFCRPDCYLNEWNTPGSLAETDMGRHTLLLETHTYNHPPIDSRTGCRRFVVPTPRDSQGHGLVVPHYISMRRNTPYVEECVRFLGHLLTDTMMSRFLRQGHLVGWAGVEGEGDAVLLETLRAGLPAAEHDPDCDRFVAEVVNPNMRNWQSGTATVDEICAAIERFRQRWLNCG